MYETAFGLMRDAFSIAPDPDFLYMSERHQEALAHLLYGLQGSGGFVLLTGEVGTGKTTVCRRFIAQTPDNVSVAYIYNPSLDVPELLATLAQEFGLPPLALPPGVTSPSAKDEVDRLNRFLLDSHAAGRACVLVIDEAQNLSLAVLEQLRLLTNLETPQRKLLHIVLIGQPELRAFIARPDLEALAQRIIARYHLRPLDQADTRQYVAHRLAAAGRDPHQPLPFDAPALRQIHRASGGVPRRINLLCSRALLGAWTRGQTHITAATVRQAAREVFDPLPGAGATGKTTGLNRSANALRAAGPWLALAILALLVLATLAWLARQTGPAQPMMPAPAAPRTAPVNSSVLRHLPSYRMPNLGDEPAPP